MLVMFFVFHILVLIIPFYKVTSAPHRANNPDIASFPKGNVQILSFKDCPSQNASAFRTQKPMFQILRNLTKSLNSNNLKSNIFDKMLSDEMLSMKQRFFEKDLVYSSTANKVKQNPAPTPTIEVQQKWSVVDLFTNPIIDEVITTTAKDGNDVLVDNENSVESDLMHDDLKSNNTSENKILELRSLPSARHVETNQNQALVSSCANNHMHVTPKCSCTRLDHQRCTHTIAETGASYSVYPLYLQPYQNFLFNDNLENPYQNVYYHPKVVDELKVPKKTKRRKTRPPPADLYYEDSRTKELDDDEYTSRPRTNRPQIFMNIDYELVDDKPKNSSCKKGDGNSFNLMKDLDEVFNDGVNKKCYCSHSSLILPKQRNTSFIFMIVLTFQCFYYKIIFFD